MTWGHSTGNKVAQVEKYLKFGHLYWPISGCVNEHSNKSLASQLAKQLIHSRYHGKLNFLEHSYVGLLWIIQSRRGRCIFQFILISREYINGSSWCEWCSNVTGLKRHRSVFTHWQRGKCINDSLSQAANIIPSLSTMYPVVSLSSKGWPTLYWSSFSSGFSFTPSSAHRNLSFWLLYETAKWQDRIFSKSVKFKYPNDSFMHQVSKERKQSGELHYIH
jgi:hypothetical protein